MRDNLDTMATELTHEGIVMFADEHVARVRIVQQSACSGCHARSMCQASESMVKEMMVEVLEPMQVGDRVEVAVEQRLGWKAVFYAFLLPMLLMMLLLFVGQYLWHLEGWVSGLIALGMLVPYYGVLHLFEGRFQRQYRFVAHKL